MKANSQPASINVPSVGTKENREEKIPYESNKQTVQKAVDYTSMKDAIRSIENPVSFDELKLFYGIEG